MRPKPIRPMPAAVTRRNHEYQKQVAYVLRRTCRADLQGNIRLRRNNEWLNDDRLGVFPCTDQRAGARFVRPAASGPGRPRRRAVRGDPPCPEFPRWLL